MSEDYLLSTNFFYGVQIDLISPVKLWQKCEEAITHKKKFTISFLSPSCLSSLFYWRFWNLKNPENLKSLRKMDLVILEDDLFHKNEPFNFHPLFSGWKDHDRKILIIGSHESDLLEYKTYWQSQFPNLLIDIFVIELNLVGESLEELAEDDALLVEEIERRGPNILILDLKVSSIGSIVDRLSCRLKVPVVIGLNMTKEQPSFLDSLKLNTLKFINQFKTYIDKKKCELISRKNPPENPFHFYFGQDQIKFSILSFPKVFCGKIVTNFAKNYNFETKYDLEVFDISHVESIDSQGFNLIMKLFKHHRKNKSEIYLIGMNNTLKKAMLNLSIYEYFFPFIYTKREQLIRSFEALKIHFVWSVNYIDEKTVVSFFGQIDVRNVQTYAFENITAKLLGSVVIFNFEWCNSIDSSGLGFLLRLRRYLKQLNKEVIICGLNEYILQTFKITKVDKLFNMTDSLSSALKLKIRPSLNHD